MSAATSTILTIAGIGAAAGTQLYGASRASGASSHAADVQSASADKALAVQERMYQQQRADEAPYLGLGTGAVGALQYGLGLTPTPEKSASAAQPYDAVAAAKNAAAPWAGRPDPTKGVPQGPVGMKAGGPPPTSGPATGGVPMRAPNGQVTRVPPDQVAHYRELGAQVI